MSQERSTEAPHPSLAEILSKQREDLEHIAAQQDVPLLLHELPHIKKGIPLPWTGLNTSEVANIVGWPTLDSWAGEPSTRFKSGEAGDVEFYIKAVERSDSRHGTLYGLNNFWAILHTEPYAFDGEMSRTALGMAYGPMPALIRAWTAYPEFMGALHRELGELDSIFNVRDVLHKQAGSEEPDLISGARLAYGLLTRLVRSDDQAKHHALQNTMFTDPNPDGPTRHFKAITDPSIELWT